jgi:HAD superfamily hydrolase (TIGR01484 family)
MKPSTISLLLADVDGTLVTHDKVLTERAQQAVRRLRQVGIHFAITSGRPPKGMAMLIEPLRMETPIAGFNGGLFVQPDLSIIEEKLLSPDLAARTIDLILGRGLLHHDHHRSSFQQPRS